LTSSHAGATRHRNDARELKDASKQSRIKKIAKGMKRPRQNLSANPDGSIDL
jgi:hypothetical protein